MHDPIPIVKYAKAKHLLDQQPFKTLGLLCVGVVPSRLRKIYEAKVHVPRVNKATTAIFGRKYKFGIQVPYSVKHALQLDKENGNTLWKDAIQKEMD